MENGVDKRSGIGHRENSSLQATVLSGCLVFVRRPAHREGGGKEEAKMVFTDGLNDCGTIVMREKCLI